MNFRLKLPATFPRLTKKRLPSVMALLAGLEVGPFRPGARVKESKYFQHGGRAENTEFTEARGGSSAAAHDQRVIQIDASARAARSATLFLRDLHVLRSSSVLKMLSRHAVEDYARNAHLLSSRSQPCSRRVFA
jgi:hypothetical protein